MTLTATKTRPAPTNVMVPRPHQEKAISGVLAALARADRTQLHMACGSGKTLVGIHVSHALDAQRTAVICPSLALVEQTIRDWSPTLTAGTRILIVCSDPSTAAGQAEREGADPADFSLKAWNTGPRKVAHPTVVTTDAARAGNYLHLAGPVLIVSTYHSSGVLAEALHESGTPLDLLIADEAHHLAGKVHPAFRPVLQARVLPARKRLFMTATPITLAVTGLPGLDDVDDVDDGESDELDSYASDSNAAWASMDDETLFGAVAYRYSTGAAIQDGYLCDYKVVVVADKNLMVGDRRLPLETLATAVRAHGLRRVLSFHNRIAAAAAFADLAGQYTSPDLSFDTKTVNSSTKIVETVHTLARLAEPIPDGVTRMVTAAKCLREGIDVPAVDGILFADPRSSTVDIIQSIGRALRPHPGKTHGVIIIPVAVPDGADDDEDLAMSAYGHVWRILRGLNAHDPRIADSLQAIQRRPDSRDHTRALAPDWLTITGGPDVNTAAVLTRIVKGAAPRWERLYNLTMEYARDHGGAHTITSSVRVGKHSLGGFVIAQRHLHRKLLLSPARADKLNLIPGWTWSIEHQADLRLLDLLRDHVAMSGTSRDVPAGPSAYVRATARQTPLGRWLARVRRAHRENTVDPTVITGLEALPGFTWEPLTPEDRAGVEAFATFVMWEKHGNVPLGHVEDGVALADWLAAQGYRYLAGTLSPELHEELLAVAPTNTKGDPAFTWNVSALRFNLGVLALQQYYRREQTLTVPPGHTETVHDVPVKLYQWAARQRWLQRRQQLTLEQVSALAAVPCWSWDLVASRAPKGAPMVLPAGVVHGTIDAANNYRCPCPPCVTQSRTAASAWKRDRKTEFQTSWRPCPKGARNLTVLARTIPNVTPRMIADALGMPGSLLRALIADHDTRVPPRFHTAMQTLTAADVNAWVRPSTRGRIAARGDEPGDPARVNQLTRDLSAAGWTRMAMACALGYAGSAKLPFTTTRVTFAQQAALELFVAHLGDDLTPPEQYVLERKARTQYSSARSRQNRLTARLVPAPHP